MAILDLLVAATLASHPQAGEQPPAATLLPPAVAEAAADEAQQGQPSRDTAAPTVQPTSGGRVLAAPPPLAAGETETVTRVRYTVTTEGRVEGCSVIESDATDAIQRNICATLTERARFKPKLEDGKPVAVTEEKTVRFRTSAVASAPATPASAPAARRTDLPPGR